MRHVIRPYKWNVQVCVLLPTLKSRDVLELPTRAMCAATSRLFTVWKIKPKVKIVASTDITQCVRCGGTTYSGFCDSCDHGQLHARTCIHVWTGYTHLSLGMLRLCGQTPETLKKLYNVNSDGNDYGTDQSLPFKKFPCTCGGLDVADSVRHYEDQLQLQQLHGRVQEHAGCVGAR